MHCCRRIRSVFFVSQIYLNCVEIILAYCYKDIFNELTNQITFHIKQRKQHARPICHVITMHNKPQLESMATANALHLEAAGATPAVPLCRFNYDAMRSLKSLNHCCIIAFFLLIHYFAL